MLTLNISEADIVAANYERIHNPLRRIRKRMDAIYWTSQGFSRQKIAQLSGVHRNSVRSYITHLPHPPSQKRIIMKFVNFGHGNNDIFEQDTGPPWADRGAGLIQEIGIGELVDSF